MTKEKKNLRLYLLLLAIVMGAFLAAVFIHYNLQTHKGRLIIGDSTQGLLNNHSSNNLSSWDGNQAAIGGSVVNLGDVGQN